MLPALVLELMAAVIFFFVGRPPAKQHKSRSRCHVHTCTSRRTAGAPTHACAVSAREGFIACCGTNQKACWVCLTQRACPAGHCLGWPYSPGEELSGDCCVLCLLFDVVSLCDPCVLAWGVHIIRVGGIVAGMRVSRGGLLVASVKLPLCVSACFFL